MYMYSKYLHALDEISLAPSADGELEVRPRQLPQGSHGTSSNPARAPDDEDPRVLVVPDGIDSVGGGGSS